MTLYCLYSLSILQHLELVSEFQTNVHRLFLLLSPNVFIMKLSLIAATLAGITGSVIATPVPLHARALQQVNSFEQGEVAVVEREERPRWASDHKDVAQILRKVHGDTILGPYIATTAGHLLRKQKTWQQTAASIEQNRSRLDSKARQHDAAASATTEGSLHSKVKDDKRFAESQLHELEKITQDAQKAINDHHYHNSSAWPRGSKAREVLGLDGARGSELPPRKKKFGLI